MENHVYRLWHPNLRDRHRVLAPDAQQPRNSPVPYSRRKIAARRRLDSEHGGGDKTNFSLKHLIEAALDFKSYTAFLYGILLTAPSPVLTFASPTPLVTPFYMALSRVQYKS
ncbi:hypothetical protein G7Y89_g4985 [Cudoniella acicularis]|uniref:Uncharacterized protein n=1 Tax=Cudoniella acicularis TaxID=354080 RepID=A0A8H4W471_9HELO|nr:hypothetical protein G7Y89_g4985 [Cudoniella acicularis]